LKVCVVHGTRVSSEEVAYIGWKSYGSTSHWVDGFGAKTTCPKPLTALALMEPVSCVVVSSFCRETPLAESVIVTRRSSRGAMRRSRSGCTAPVVFGPPCSGSGGAWGCPSRVTKAKLVYSIPPCSRFAHALFSVRLWIGSRDRLKIASAAHQRVSSQLGPTG